MRPGLAVILVGEDPAFRSMCATRSMPVQAGFHSEKYAFPADIAPQAVFDKIAELNADPKIHGILVQLPLPGHFDADAVLEAIAQRCRRLCGKRRRPDGGTTLLHPGAPSTAR